VIDCVANVLDSIIAPRETGSNEAANLPVLLREDTGASLGTAMINLAAGTCRLF